MPPALSPQQTLDLVFVEQMTEQQQQMLRTGQHAPALKSQRALKLRFGSVEDTIAIEEVFDKADAALKAQKVGTYQRHVCDAVRLVLAGWQHMTDVNTGTPVAFDPAKLEKVLDAGDVGELRQRLLPAMSIGAADRKKSAWRLPSEQDKSASPAAPATA